MLIAQCAATSENNFFYFFDFYLSSYSQFSPQFSSVITLINIKFFTQNKNSSEVVKFTWKMHNELKRMRNHFSDLCDFYILSYGWFCTQNCSILRWFLSSKSTITQKLKSEYLKKLFFIRFSSLCIFHVNLTIYEEFFFVKLLR